MILKFMIVSRRMWGHSSRLEQRF